MSNALSTVERFSRISGLEINKTKSEAMQLGSKKQCVEIFFQLCLEDEGKNS